MIASAFSSIVSSISSAVGKAEERKKSQLDAKAKVLEAEARHGSWLQRNWRPLLMLLIMAILANNYLVVPYLNYFAIALPVLEFPEQFWQLLYIGVGGYIGGHSFEKVFVRSSLKAIKSTRKRNKEANNA